MSFWCHDIIHVHIVGPEGQRDVVVERPYAQVGYHSQSEIVLEGPGVRKRALFLLATKIGVYALNLDRQEAPLDEAGRWITSDEPIVVGPYQLTISLASGKLASPGMPGLADARAALPIPVLHVFGDGLLKDRRRLRHPLCLVGRRPQCGLQLRGEKVSSYHAALYWQDHRLWCIDLSSGNGTLLNGEPLTCSEVQLNDRLEIGEFGLLYYRWSPRHTTPGMEHLPAEDEGAIWESAQRESIEGTQLAATTELNEAQLRDKLAAEFEERLTGERQAFEGARAAWEHERIALEAELERVKAEAQSHDGLTAELEKQLADQRQAFEAAQATWQSEREKLQAELDRVKAELHALAAKADSATERPLAQTRPADAREEVPAPHFEIEVEEKRVESDAPGEPEADSRPFHLPQPDEPLPVVSQEAGASAAEEMVAVAVKPVTRRRSQPRDELASFVSGRLGDLEHAHRRRMLLIWTAAVVSALAIAGVGLGIWAWIA